MIRQPNPNAGKFKLPEGYSDLGWQDAGTNELRECMRKGHKRRRIDNSTFLNRGTDVIDICDTCKCVWHTDMSD